MSVNQLYRINGKRVAVCKVKGDSLLYEMSPSALQTVTLHFVGVGRCCCEWFCFAVSVLTPLSLKCAVWIGYLKSADRLTVKPLNRKTANPIA